jgi:hypothetical protein
MYDLKSGASEIILTRSFKTPIYEYFSALGIYKAESAIASITATIVSFDLVFSAKTLTKVSGISDFAIPIRFLLPF